MHRTFATLVLLAGCCTAHGWAQSSSVLSPVPATVSVSASSNTFSPAEGPQKGSNEWQVWAGWAYPLKLFWDDPLAKIGTTGLRYGRVLTDEHGPGPLRGRLEMAFDLVPLVDVSLPGRRVYGGGFDPFVLKWNFETHRHLSPYWEFSGGGVFSNHQVVSRTTTFNFMPSSAIGVRFPWGRSGKYSWSTEIRYFHISNGGLTEYNPGLNTIELRIGFGFFSRRP